MLLLWKGFKPQWFKGLGSHPFHSLLVCHNFIKFIAVIIVNFCCFIDSLNFVSQVVFRDC